MDVGDKYACSDRANSFIPDLLTVDAPQLFQHTHSTATRSGNLDQKFIGQLTSYIRTHSLRKSLLQNLPRIMVSSEFVEWKCIVLLQHAVSLSNIASLLHLELFNFGEPKSPLNTYTLTTVRLEQCCLLVAYYLMH